MDTDKKKKKAKTVTAEMKFVRNVVGNTLSDQTTQLQLLGFCTY